MRFFIEKNRRKRGPSGPKATFVFLLLTFSLLFAHLVEAQAVGSRTEFVFHVYVNPQSGDDTLASLYNPQSSGPNTALTSHPYQVTTPPPIAGVIQHAPYEFRTVTGALNYINTNFPNLPWYCPSPPYYTIKRIVIHCLPGIYAEWLSPESEPIDPKNGLIYNGEVFPLGSLIGGWPNHVSLQGTSALDVIFDGRGRDGVSTHIFKFDLALGGIIYDQTFIDSITIRNVRCFEDSLVPDGAGVVITGESNVQVTISNSIITDCHIGVAIDSYPPNPLIWCHSPVLVNNTIAWNQIGVYSGVISFAYSPRLGYARPRCYNNIFDPRDPDTQFPSVSCFEGLDSSDLTVYSLAGTVVKQDYNAYDPALCNLNVYPCNWQPTAPRGGSAYSPRVDLSSYTQNAPLYNILYINDNFRVSQMAANNMVSRSPHDFRLSPMALTEDLGFHLNPLVNMGVDTSLGPIEFANYYSSTPSLSPVISIPPGLPGPGAQSSGAMEDVAALHAEDWDLEGFGNFRIDPAWAFPRPPANSTNIDIGADEVGSLIMAGFIDGTRIFSGDHPVMYPYRTQGFPGVNDEIFFFNVYTTGNAYWRPEYDEWTSQVFYENNLPYTGSWWNYYQTTPVPGNNPVRPFTPIVPYPATDPSGNMARYTMGHDGSTGSYSLRRVLTTNLNWEPFMRNRECDFTSALLIDIHPLWGAYKFSSTTPPVTDVFGCNPWYHHNSSIGASFDNPFIYYGTYSVLDGTMNPPGTYIWTAGVGFLYSWGSHPVYPYFDPQNRGLTQYSVNQWGYGEASLPWDMVPDSNWEGRRHNCQVRQLVDDTWIYSNLQTFLTIYGDDDSSDSDTFDTDE